jgi:hypothetical protein
MRRLAWSDCTVRGRVPPGLSETGYVEGQNVAIEYRWAEGQYDRLPGLAADLVGRKIDLIATSAAGARAAKDATSTIPIVTLVGDPVLTGLYASLARPGGNITGVSPLSSDLTPKRLELLAELVPQVGLIGLLVNPNNANAEHDIARGPESGAGEGGAAPCPEGRHRGRIRNRLHLPRPAACRRARRRRRSVLQQPTRRAGGAGGTPCRSGDL